MAQSPEADKKPRGGAVLIEFNPPVYQRLVVEAERLTEIEGRRVSVTEVARRRVLTILSEKAA